MHLKKIKPEIAHKDKLDQDIVPGTAVVFRNYNDIAIGIVERMTPRMVEVCRVPKSRWGSGLYRKYPHDLVTVDSEAVTMYILKHAS
jgi:hypothetical protein